MLQLAPKLERLLASLHQRDELDAAKTHPTLALLMLVAQDPRLGAADHLQVEPAPVTVASRLGVPDLRRCQLPHRFILASIPGFVGASSGLYRRETEQRKV